MHGKKARKMMRQAWQDHEQHQAMPYFRKSTVHLWVRSALYGMQSQAQRAKIPAAAGIF